MTGETERLKQAQRQAWQEGDYRPFSRRLEPAARLLVDRAGVTAGQRVLDVATGAGSVALAAARAGAEVLGVDLTEAWFAEARREADRIGADVSLAVGDAEDLPIDDASVDAALSSFGAIFAPRHDVVAAELARVCRPGGTIAFTAWTPGGASDRMFSVLRAHLPPPPEAATPSIRWGDPAHVREQFAPHGVTFTFEHSSLTWAFPSIEDFESFLFETAGPTIVAQRTLRDLGRWDEAYTAVHGAIQELNEAGDGSFRLTYDFLVAVGRRP